MKKSIDERFRDFHAANPDVYDGLVRLARAGKARGAKKLGIEQLYAVLRWETFMRTSRDSGFKLNDHFTSRYARLIMEQEPDLAGIFEIRRLRSAELTPPEIYGPGWDPPAEQAPDWFPPRVTPVASGGIDDSLF